MPELSKYIEAEIFITPDYFEKELNTKYGSGFSIEPIFTQSAYFRFHNQSELLDNLYFVGAELIQVQVFQVYYHQLKF